MKVELSSSVAEWLETELASGRFRTADEGLHHAVDQAKLADLRAELEAAERRGGACTSDEVRAYVRRYLDQVEAAAES